MIIKVPGLTLLELERQANQLLTEYAETIDGPVPTPIPVDKIAENHLGLRVKFADLHKYYQLPRRSESTDILGAMQFEVETILIDQSLDPQIFSRRVGRYRYSVAHEIGHWRLHRSAFLKKLAGTGRPPVACRETGSSERVPPVEQQADYFASYLLLPADRVLNAWGDAPSFLFDVFESGSKELQRRWISKESDEKAALEMFKSECDLRFDQLAEPFAWTFQVSVQAMRIRLERLGLLRRSRAVRAKSFS